MSLSTVTSNNKTVRMGALIGIGALIDKSTLEGGRLLEGGAYWKEGAKSNHYGMFYSTEQNPHLFKSSF